MTDEALIAKRLAFVETCLRELRTLARPAVLEQDVRERRFIEHTLQLAIQAVLDTASHIVADERIGEPETRAQLFSLLESAGWLSADLAERLARMTGMRNILVHGYTAVDLGLLRDVVENHLGDLDGFVAAIQSRLSCD